MRVEFVAQPAEIRKSLCRINNKVTVGGKVAGDGKCHGAPDQMGALGSGGFVCGLDKDTCFMGLTGNRAYGATVNGRRGTVTSTNDYNHSFLVGFRYAFNQAPLRAAEPIADLGAKTFLVFFDHNKYDLTSQARGIVQSAASYSTRTQYTRIDVDGNADTSGSPGYNIGLSQRRAEMVQAELIRDGVPANAIAVHAYGDTKLLVPTGPGVREPQNRRVEIVYR